MVQKCTEMANTYSKMLKQILPQNFKEEYLTLKAIQDRKANINEIFTKASKDQREKLDKIT